MTSKRQKNAGWKIPDIITVPGTRSYCVTIPDDDMYRDAFLGALGTLQKWWNWEKSYNYGDERAKEAAQLWRNVLNHVQLLDCSGGVGMASIFRDNPDDLCEVQYSNDAGITWQTMFRKDNCVNYIPPPFSPEIINNSNTTIINNNITYAGDITNVANTFVWTTIVPGAGAITNRAICWAVSQYVDLICDARATEISRNRYWADGFGDFASWTFDQLSIGAGIMGLNGGIVPASTVIDATSWSFTKIIDSIYDSVFGNPDWWNDADARQVVKCHIYGNLNSNTVQFIDWSTALDDFVPSNTPETKISEAVAASMLDEDVYVNFLIYANDISLVSDSLPSCGCPEPFTINQLRGSIGTEFWGTAYTQPSNISFGDGGLASATISPGIWRVNNQRYTEIASDVGGVACNLEVILPDNVLITRVRVKMTAGRPNETTQGDRQASVWLGNPNKDGIKVGGHYWGAGFYTEQSITTDAQDNNGLLATPRAKIYIHNSMDKNGGTAHVDWIFIKGIVYTP